MLRSFLIWLRTLKREQGQDLAEYALLLALVAIAAVAVLMALSGGVNSVFQRVVGALSNALQ